MSPYDWEKKRAEIVNERMQKLARCNPASVDSPDNYSHRNASNLREYLSEINDEDLMELVIRFDEFYRTRSKAALESIGNALFYNSQEWWQAKALERAEEETPGVMELDYQHRMDAAEARYQEAKDLRRFMT